MKGKSDPQIAMARSAPLVVVVGRRWKKTPRFSNKGRSTIKGAAGWLPNFEFNGCVGQPTMAPHAWGWALWHEREWSPVTTSTRKKEKKLARASLRVGDKSHDTGGLPWPSALLGSRDLRLFYVVSSTKNVFLIKLKM